MPFKSYRIAWYVLANKYLRLEHTFSCVCICVNWIFNMDSMYKKEKLKQSVETGNINLSLAEHEIHIHSILERGADIRIFTNEISSWN